MYLDKVKDLCAQRGISIAKLERESKIGNGTVARWDRGNPSLESLIKVAKYFGVPVEELMQEQVSQFANSTGNTDEASAI